ncbi:MAG: hypothetical protein ACPGWR_07345 [Ardenticatenaceae bacterium]
MEHVAIHPLAEVRVDPRIAALRSIEALQEFAPSCFVVIPSPHACVRTRNDKF